MSKSASESGQVSANAAEVYERELVPALFEEWAPRVADLAGISRGQSVLDVACGTGILAREVARRVGPGGSVAGCDPNPGMIAVARERAPDIAWHLAPAEELPFAPGQLDAVVCQFGLMFFEDRVRALREMLRVTKQGGPVAIAVWDAIERSDGYFAYRRALGRLFGESIARSIDAPFCLGQRETLLALVGSVSSDPELTQLTGTARFASLADWVRSTVRGWTLADALDEDALTRLTEELETELSHLVLGDGTFRFGTSVHVVRLVAHAR
jgi:ubiquinone/menaquinone biosynthesis C-methylase UbiE